MKRPPRQKEPKTLNVRPKSEGQQEYLKAIDNNEIVFCFGLPGTGKTYLAVAKALQALINNQISQIVITRPNVEAGEHLGYLPGDVDEKSMPFAKPIFHNMLKIISKEDFTKLRNTDKIVIEPLAYMRGCTYDDSFMILDEAQNATISQIEMFLTRLGEGSKAVICGDPMQHDIQNSGLAPCALELNGMESTKIIRLSDSDVIRHRLIGEIVKRLERAKRSPQYRLENMNGNSKKPIITR